MSKIIITCTRCGESREKHAKGMCRSCYQINWSGTKNPRERSTKTHCENCSLQFSVDYNHKGRLVERASKGLCRTCYNKIANKICSICGGLKKKRSQGPCSNCKIKRNQKEIIEAVPTITKEDMREIKLLIIRWRSGFISPVDAYVIADLYLRTHEGANGYKLPANMSIDNYDEMTQSIAMLKLLKITYDNNK